MTGLYEPSRHETLAGVAWDAGAAQAAIGRIVADTRKAFAAQALWPIHPDDGPAEWGALAGLYFGAAGVIWALDYLQRQGAAPEGQNFTETLSDIQGRNARFIAAFGNMTSGYMLGDTGVLLVRWRIEGDQAILDRLESLITSNTEAPAQELMWGSPGTMLAALTLHKATGEPRWGELFRASATSLRTMFRQDRTLRARIWTQDLYGQCQRFIGALHGLAGNAYVLWRGRDLLGPHAWRTWEREIAETVRVTATREGELANWPQQLGERSGGNPGVMLVQHCHGSPGMITSLAGFGPELDELLAAAGELTWRAGPLTKGANLCHGTAGNGYALLKLYERTGSDLWLERARALAMHAIAQSETRAAQVGRRRYSLWTGDLGLACYLWDCIQAQARFPTLDVL
ncbi:MAG: LanC-like protein [Caulobacteraceae bacterium]|nr:LanC-like protein [Caulobacteraceae bacterium]